MPILFLVLLCCLLLRKEKGGSIEILFMRAVISIKKASADSAEALDLNF